MTVYENVESAARPPELRTDDHSAYVCTDIEEVTREGKDGEPQAMYRYRMERYSLGEYVAKQAAEKADLERQLTNVQLAVCELAEGGE